MVPFEGLAEEQECDDRKDHKRDRSCSIFNYVTLITSDPIRFAGT